MKNINTIFLVFFLFVTISNNKPVKAQHYDQSKSLQTDTENETGEKRTVFSFSLYTGLNNAIMSKDYRYYSSGIANSDVLYTAYPVIGTNLGMAWKFHFGSFYNMGLETVYSTERFDIEESGDIMKTSYIEMILINEMNFSKSISALFGPSVQIGLQGYNENVYNYSTGICMYLGLKYNHKSGLFASMRYKLNFTGLIDGEEIYIYEYSAWDIEKSVDVSSMQLNVGYTIPLAKKSKKKKKVKPVETDYYRPPVVTEEVKPVKPDYSEYSNGRLNELLEEFLKKEDYENAKFVQEELDKRNIGSEYENLSLDELKKLLEEALLKEDYEKAAVIQEIIDKRNK